MFRASTAPDTVSSVVNEKNDCGCHYRAKKKDATATLSPWRGFTFALFQRDDFIGAFYDDVRVLRPSPPLPSPQQDRNGVYEDIVKFTNGSNTAPRSTKRAPSFVNSECIM